MCQRKREKNDNINTLRAHLRVGTIVFSFISTVVLARSPVHLRFFAHLLERRLRQTEYTRHTRKSAYPHIQTRAHTIAYTYKAHTSVLLQGYGICEAGLEMAPMTWTLRAQLYLFGSPPNEFALVQTSPRQ